MGFSRNRIRNRKYRSIRNGPPEGGGNGFRRTSLVRSGDVRKRAANGQWRNETLPKLRTQRSRAHFPFIARRPCGNGTPGVDFESGNAERGNGGFPKIRRTLQWEKIENGCGESSARNETDEFGERLVAEKRKNGDAEIRELFRHLRYRLDIEGQMPEISVRPRRVANGRDDEGNVPVVREFRREKKAAVPIRSAFAVGYVENGSFPEMRKSSKPPNSFGIGFERASYRKYAHTAIRTRTASVEATSVFDGISFEAK